MRVLEIFIFYFLHNFSQQFPNLLSHFQFAQRRLATVSTS